MKCQNCGKEIPGSAAYCAYCGVSTQPGGSATPPAQAIQSLRKLEPSTRGKRFANMIIDGIILSVLNSWVGLPVLLLLLQGLDYVGVLFLNWLIIPFIYFFGSELMWSKSPAKFLTKTHVVSEAGAKPEATYVLIRSVARLIPFEQFSFLFRRRPVGWHDRLARTRVVDDR